MPNLPAIARITTILDFDVQTAALYDPARRIQDHGLVKSAKRKTGNLGLIGLQSQAAFRLPTGISRWL